MSEPQHADRRKRRAVLARWVLGLGIGAVAVWVALAAAGGLSDFWVAIRHLSGWWLVPAFVIEAASYAVLGAKFRQLIGRDVVSSLEAIELGLVISGFGPLTPASPAEGLAIAATHLRRRGLVRRHIVMVFGLSQWLSARVFLSLGAINLLVVASIERHPFGHLWPYLVMAIVVLVLLGFTARVALRQSSAERVGQIVGSLRRPSRRVSVDVRRASGAAWYHDARELLGPPRHRIALVSLTAIPLLADVACLWFALIAAGAHVGFDVALLAVTVASASAFIPLVPGGIGIVEATIPAVTHYFGVPYDQGLAATLVYRGFGTFLPAAFGALAIGGLRIYARSPK